MSADQIDLAALSPPPWGRSVVSGSVDGHECRLYEPRRRSVGELLADARRWGPRRYLVHGNRSLTFAEHDAAVRRVSARLHGMGVVEGTRVLFLARNSLEWVTCFWAALRLGAVPVLGNAWWSEREIAYAIDDVGPTLVVVDERRLARLPAETRSLLVAEVEGDLDDTASDGDGSTPRQAAAENDENRPAVMVFTSGTTGTPKAAMLSHRALISSLHSLLLVTNRLPSELPDDFDGGTTLFTVPLFHLGGVQAVIIHLLTGGTLVFPEDKFEAGEVLRLIEQERVRSWSGVIPTMISRVLDHPDLAHRDTTSLVAFTLGGSMVPTELVNRIRQAFPQADRRVAVSYGMTECGTATTASGQAVLERPGTVGRPLPVTELQIDEPDAAGVGEVLLRSPSVMSGYWNRPDEQIVDSAGWLHTGDLGRVDDDGYLFIVGRSKDIVIRGGENISCPHVEAALLEHPAVSEVAVLGLPHPDLGEELAAAVVMRAGRAADVEDLRAHAADRLAYFEVPTRWWLRDRALPQNATGKVLKAELRREWTA